MNHASLWLFVSAALATGAAIVSRAANVEPLTSFGFALLGLLLLCAAEVGRHSRRDALWLADPCVLVTIWIFGVYYGASNLVYFSEEGLANAQFADFPPMTDLTLMASAACFLMWRGHGLPLLRDVVRRLDRLLPRPHIDRVAAPQLVGWACAALFLTSIAARVLAINLGTYGYSQEDEGVERWLDYAYALRVLGGMGILVLTGVSLIAFRRQVASRHLLAMLTLITLVEMAFGFMSGFKQAVVMPILVVAACYYVCRARVPVGLLVASAAALFLAYLVVQPFRVIRFEDSSFDPYSVASIVTSLSRAFTDYQTDTGAFISETAWQISYRLNLTGIGAEGLQFSREVGHMDGAPSFLSGFLLFPLLAFVPRIVWPSKPVETIGGWYTQVVLGRPEDLVTSSGMGPLTFLYFGGGIVAILLGFLILGALYRVIREVLLHSSPERMFLFVSILPTLVVLEAGNLHSVLVTLLRLLPILLVVQYLMFTRPPRRAGDSNPERSWSAQRG